MKRRATPLEVIEVFKRSPRPASYSFFQYADDYAIVTLAIPYKGRKVIMPAITHASGIITSWAQAKDGQHFPAQDALVYFNEKRMWQDWEKIKGGLDWYDLEKKRQKTKTIAVSLHALLYGEEKIPNPRLS